ncbi:hypothetical protein DM02DRAFT_613788 [Periconia macrospinosa]|uniref:NAD(P)-binding domain-containing protein n=1 Tax=Periconia macrospinosa TaxID=97972 RepID=A0A2V1DVJ5_9PLEO|nr:hypothetical protein DM02DRAFT_613788 [Periconia macrospinosa]
MLQEKHSVPASTISSNLTTVRGNIYDIESIKSTLISPNNPNHLVDTIVSGMGGKEPRFQLSLINPMTIEDPHICETSMASIFSAIDALAEKGVHTAVNGTKPLLVSVSTISLDQKRDLPYLYYILEFWLLRVMRDDKLKTELLIKADGGKHIRNFVLMRPSLLTDQPRGVDKLQVGWVWGIKKDEAGRPKEPGPKIGYAVARDDLGAWIYDHVIKEGGWEGKCVSLVY